MHNASLQLNLLRQTDLTVLQRQQAEVRTLVASQMEMNYNDRIIQLEEGLTNATNQMAGGSAGANRQLRRRVTTFTKFPILFFCCCVCIVKKRNYCDDRQ